MRALIIIVMIVVSLLCAGLSIGYGRQKKWTEALLFLVISSFSGFLVLAGFFDWFGG